jgi:alkanesulfonate monooxygenase SsuD/methylene tetrahydromethanopterin reductase-like flavin-dependent oxidoreductase (luciferase family)
MDEMIEILRGLWQGGMFGYSGECFDFEPIAVSPQPTLPIPIYFGGAAPVALRRTAVSGDGWIGAGNTPEAVPSLLGDLAKRRAQSGRESLPFESIVGLYGDVDLDTYRRLEDAGMTSGVHLPFHFAFGGPSSLDRKRRLMEEFAESTLRHLG